MKALIFSIIGIIVLAGIVVFAYIYNEQPIQEGSTIQYQNISLAFYDDSSAKQIRSGYVITLGESREAYMVGNTTENDFTFIRVPQNSTFYIFNTNLENQTYYTTRYTAVSADSDMSKVIRAQVPLTPYGNITITQDQKLSYVNNNVYLTLESPGIFRYVTLCYQWSPNILSVTNPDFEQLPESKIPQRLHNKVVKCYITKQSIMKTTMKINVKYFAFAKLNADDNIKVYILDGDIRYYSINGPDSFILEDTNMTDVGTRDIEFTIK